MIEITQTVEAYIGGVWVDISADVLDGVTIKRGVLRGTPLDRVASAGTLTMRLNNSETNSAGLLGYYSVGHTNTRSGWGVATPVRVSYSDGTTTAYKFGGYVTSIEPVAGTSGPRYVSVTATDYIGILGARAMPTIDVQVGKRPDEILDTIITALDIHPDATDYDTDTITYQYALDIDYPERTSALTAVTRVVNSAMGYLYVGCSAASHEILTYRKYNARVGGIKTSLSDTMQALRVACSLDAMRNYIRVVITPRRVDSSAVVLAQLQQTIDLAPGETRTIAMYYVDPSNQAERVSGINMITPVAGTDYNFGTTDGGSDLNSDIAVSVVFGGTSADVTLTNNAAVTGYLSGMQLRGYGVYAYNSVDARVEDSASIALYGKRELVRRMAYLGDYTTATSLASMMLNIVGESRYTSADVTLAANKSASLASAAIDVDIGDGVQVIETVAGLDAVLYVSGLTTRYKGGILTVTWHLVDGGVPQDVFILGSATNGILGTNVLGA